MHMRTQIEIDLIRLVHDERSPTLVISSYLWTFNFQTLASLLQHVLDKFNGSEPLAANYIVTEII